MSEMIYTNINGYDVATKGNVVINGTLHMVSARFVKCDSSLNRRSCNITDEVNRCKICFPELQIDLFERKRLFFV